MKNIEPKDRLGNLVLVGDSVILIEIPDALVANLPPEDQEAIRAQKGNSLTIEGFDDWGNGELEFIDARGHLHTIWIAPAALVKVIKKGNTHYIAKILDDAGEVVGYAVFDLDGNQVNGVMSRQEDAEELWKRLENGEEEEPPPPGGRSGPGI